MAFFPLISSDLICVTIVLYVWVRMYTNPTLEPKTVRLFRYIGITLIATVIVDHIWEYFYETSDLSPISRQLLNTIASIEFLCIPVVLFFLLMYHRKKWDLADSISLAADIIFFILDIVNIWYPISFYLDKDFAMTNAPYAAWLYLGGNILFVFILAHDFLMTYNSDYENTILVIFVMIIAALGSTGCYFDGDVIAIWECFAIVYLLLYLAMVRLYDKTDQVTGLPNRNAFTTAYFRRTKNQVPVLVSFDVNHLKQFNDASGHKAGDRYLRAFAQTAQKCLSPYGKFYRVGGDEFCLTSASGPEQVQTALDTLHHMEKCDPAFGDFPMDFSYGLVVRKPGETNEELYTRADAEMYANKRRIEGSEAR